MKCPSLYLNARPGRRVLVPLACFANYPYFLESYEQYGIALPQNLEVTWSPTKKYLQIFDDEDEADQDWIDEVARMITRGEPVPPLLLQRDGLFDGRHRAWAAKQLGLVVVPITTLPDTPKEDRKTLQPAQRPTGETWFDRIMKRSG